MQIHPIHLAPLSSADAGHPATERGVMLSTGLALIPPSFLAKSGPGRKTISLQKRRILFSQGDAADAVFYIQKGRVRLTILSRGGKEATIALLDAGQFVGEDCLNAGHPRRSASAVAFTACTLIRIEKSEMKKALLAEKSLSDIFISFLLHRNTRIQEDLIDQLFNSSEKRLARTLLLMASYGEKSPPETVIPKVSQETLAEIVGTTRSRICFFMNRFRERGYIDYGHGVLRIRCSMLNVMLLDGDPFPMPAPAVEVRNVIKTFSGRAMDSGKKCPPPRRLLKLVFIRG